MRSLLIISTFLFFAPTAEATQWIKGADSSGGGKSVVCRDPGKRILSVELLDLYEARAMFGLLPIEMGATMEEAMANSKAKLARTLTYPHEHFAYIAKVLKNLRIMPPGTKLEPVDDASPVLLPQGCELEQTAVYVDEGLVAVDREHWERMDVRNRAALIMHEALYAITRLADETNSRRARKVVGHLFSDFEFEKVNEGIPESALTCIAATGESFFSFFSAFPNADGKVVFQFQSLRGRILYGKTVAVMEKLTWPMENMELGWGAIGALESNFETGRDLMVASRPMPDGSKELRFWDKEFGKPAKEYPIQCWANE